MSSNYETIIIAGNDITPANTYIQRTDEDGKVWAIPTDPANSDYQAYLATLVSNSAPQG